MCVKVIYDETIVATSTVISLHVMVNIVEVYGLEHMILLLGGVSINQWA